MEDASVSKILCQQFQQQQRRCSWHCRWVGRQWSAVVPAPSAGVSMVAAPGLGSDPTSKGEQESQRQRVPCPCLSEHMDVIHEYALN